MKIETEVRESCYEEKRCAGKAALCSHFKDNSASNYSLSLHLVSPSVVVLMVLPPVAGNQLPSKALASRVSRLRRMEEYLQHHTFAQFECFS